ncbi:MAG: HAD hydrolase-like protein [Candidatus Micrarchaeia archaeon]
MGIRKPSISLLEKNINENNIDKNECVIIEDDVIKDAMPAKLLGIKTILYSRFVDEIISDFENLS